MPDHATNDAKAAAKALPAPIREVVREAVVQEALGALEDARRDVLDVGWESKSQKRRSRCADVAEGLNLAINRIKNLKPEIPDA